MTTNSAGDPSVGVKTRIVCDFEGCLKSAEEATEEGYFCPVHLRKFRSLRPGGDR